MLPRFEIARRLRPVDLVRPGPLAPAPAAAVTTPLRGTGSLGLRLGDLEVRGAYDGSTVSLDVGGRELRSRRHARAADPTALGLTLTGHHLTVWAAEEPGWVARARYDLREDLDVHDEALLASLAVDAPDEATVGAFGQLGLRDVRLVTTTDGSPLRTEGLLWFTATSAGPGFFDTAHTSVWSVDPSSLDLAHRADLWFRRPDVPGVYGDHATHLVRDGAQWLVATSTWGDFEEPRTRADRRAQSSLRVTLAETTAGLLTGTHVLDTRELPLPTDGLDSIATWDPHLVHHQGRWLVGFVSAPKFFSFHPALAGGPALDRLQLLGADRSRRATEGTTLLPLEGTIRVLASDGRDGRRGQRAAYPVFDLSMAQTGVVDAPYPTNIPWPTVARLDDGSWLMLTFNGRRSGGALLGYGTHGDLVVMRST
ncbi:MAG: hypothetical protein LT071_14555 [Nocardioides sp.]|nr:hypothetical protein [Nocardioides sp.]